MSKEQNCPFQWMRDAGVPATEIDWFRPLYGTAKLAEPEAMHRVRRIVHTVRSHMARQVQGHSHRPQAFA